MRDLSNLRSLSGYFFKCFYSFLKGHFENGENEETQHKIIIRLYKSTNASGAQNFNLFAHLEVFRKPRVASVSRIWLDGMIIEKYLYTMTLRSHWLQKLLS